MENMKKRMDKILTVIIVGLFAALVFVVSWQVFSRYVLQNSSAFSEELAKILFVWVSLLTAAFIFGEKGHMNIGLVVSKLPHKIGMACQIFAGLINMMFIVFVLLFGGYMAVKLGWSQVNASIPFLTTGSIYAALPICAVFSVFYESYNIINDVRKLSASNTN